MALVVSEQGELETFDEGRILTDWRASRTFHVESDDESAFDAWACLGAGGLPSVGNVHPDTSKMAVVARSPKCLTPLRNLWEVVVEYEPWSGNPLTEPDRISWDFGNETESYAYDHSDPSVPVTNSAGEPFAELPTRLSGTIRVDVRRNVSSFSPVVAAGYSCRVNSASFTLDNVTIAPRVALMLGIRKSEQREEAGTLYHELTFSLAIRPETWDEVLADRGFHESDGSGGLKEIIKGTPPTRPETPWPLDGNGAAKANATDAPATGSFLPYPQVSFGSLNFN